MKDFELAYSFLAMATALHLNENKEEAQRCLNEAKTFGENIKCANDKQRFMNELKQAFEQFNGGNLLKINYEL